MNRSKEEIIKKTEQKKTQLLQAEREAAVWNSGKYKASSNSKMSKIFVEALRKEIDALHDELLENSGKVT